MVTGSYVLPVREFEYLFKVALIGDSSVGKTCIARRFTEYKFPTRSRETVGVDFITKHVTVDGIKCKLCIWDTAGQERYRSMGTAYYRGLDGAFVVYDIANAGSFKATQEWLQSVRENAPEKTSVCLIGNKADKEHLREVSREEATQMAHAQGIMFTETSALNGEHIDDCFEILVREIIKKRTIEKQRLDANKVEIKLAEKRFSRLSTTTTASDNNSNTVDLSLTKEPIDPKKKESKNSCGC